MSDSPTPPDAGTPELGLFAGFGVSDIEQALDWYRRFFNAEPSFRPNEREAVWQVNDRGWFYVEQLPRYGSSLAMLMTETFDSVVTELSRRGFEPARIERYEGGMAKAVFRDDDGNEISYGGVSGRSE